jgi:hypothetical protein
VAFAAAVRTTWMALVSGSEIPRAKPRANDRRRRATLGHYALPRPDGVAPYIPDGKICFWGGWGGSVIIMDAGRRMTISYARNKMDPANMRSDRTTEYCKAIFDAVTSS